MTTKLVKPPIPASHVVFSIPCITNMISHIPISPTHPIHNQSTRFRQYPFVFRPISTIRVAEQSSDYITVSQVKADLYEAIQGINRGIFGVPSEKKSEIENLVNLLESQNPTPDPTLHLDKVAGCWRLIYSTITILGSKRTKLGLRDFITLGDFFQIVDITEGKAVNVIKFNARGLNLFNGKLTIEAFFKIASKSRVNISYNNSLITPDQLMNLFRKNYDLLLGIFNPEGWLEITYVDDTVRIGRDDKGNIFILERSEENNT